MKSGKHHVMINVAVVFCLFMTISAGQAFSGTVAFFGPKVYNKEKGAPVTYTDTFSIPTGAENFRMIVRNGISDSGEVKNVSVLLNGTEIVSSSDLRANPITMKEVTLRAENQISVTLKGQGGNAIYLQLDGDLFATDPMMPTDPIQPMPPGLPMPN